MVDCDSLDAFHSRNQLALDHTEPRPSPSRKHPSRLDTGPEVDNQVQTLVEDSHGKENATENGRGEVGSQNQTKTTCSKR